MFNIYNFIFWKVYHFLDGFVYNNNISGMLCGNIKIQNYSCVFYN